ncbi:MAG: hypothetical protein ACREGJ_01200 [Candidatus Saccharimonadales bacterium]
MRATAKYLQRFVSTLTIALALVGLAPGMAHAMPMTETMSHDMNSKTVPNDCVSLCSGQLSNDARSQKTGVRIEEDDEPGNSLPYYAQFGTNPLSLTETAKPPVLSHLLWRPPDLVILHASYIS